jgi:hypothetical protein
VAIKKALDVLHVGTDTLAVCSALQESPYQLPYCSLRERILDRIACLHTRSTHDSQFQIVVAASPLAGPNALVLSSVSIVWLPTATDRSNPPTDVVHMAHSLWRPEEEKSPYFKFETCLTTASRLVDISSQRPNRG